MVALTKMVSAGHGACAIAVRRIVSRIYCADAEKSSEALRRCIAFARYFLRSFGPASACDAPRSRHAGLDQRCCLSKATRWGTNTRVSESGGQHGHSCA